MRKSLAFGIVFLLICSVFIPISLGLNVKVSKIEQPANIGNGDILFVGGDGPNNYTRIQDAIDNASHGDTVYVYDNSSPYYENLYINKYNFKLIGKNRETTVIDGRNIWNKSVVYVEGHVVVSGFTIRNSSGDLLCSGGIFGQGGGNTITGNTIINNSFGIFLLSQNDIISNNLIYNNDVGIFAEVKNHDIYHNSFINNTKHVENGHDNSWDDGRYGNYWDDYKERYPNAAESSLRPGTWNIPYEIDINDKDRHPLINQWPDPRSRTITYDSFLLSLLDGFPLLKEVILRLIR
jgi:parallel beta-helix repeat protein